ncbi:EAL domain-containing protein [Halalkalibacter urbisdiaboli]|uniref:EAL domain-containing protein n=1 Tax=Halalkalibacter urbisdiaboli TaxID=1960589 RepID=UPI000B439BB2|nr:EAL domain-containing protein [Halalkalibacter urbisdiaboli]
MEVLELMGEKSEKGYEHLYDVELKRIIKEKQLRSYYQPIVCLNTANIVGYEGLSRPDSRSLFLNPLDLFTYAEQSDQLYNLERVTRELAIERSRPWISADQKLFININSHVIYDPNFTPGYTSKLLEKFNLEPSDIVFEITERSAIKDFKAFKKVLTHYRAQGYKVAIDDAGAGYSSLQAITEIEPDYIKIDRSLISDIDKLPTKEAIVQAFITFAKQMNSKVIAEGIETKDELLTLMRLGVDYAQGYFLSRPQFPGGKINDMTSKLIQRLAVEECELGTLKIFFEQSTRKDLEEYFALYPEEQKVAMIERGRVVGLITKSSLNKSTVPMYGKVLARGFREHILQANCC